MKFMNEDEIDRAIEIIGDHAPEFSRYAKYLGDWKDVVNSNSDGWPYWKIGARSADKLMTLLQRAIDVVAMRGGTMPTEGEFRKSLSPIKAAATKHKLEAPALDDATPATPAP